MITFIKYFKYFHMEDVIKILRYCSNNSNILSMYSNLSHLFLIATSVREVKILKPLL